MSEIQLLIGRRLMRSYSSWGTRHHCPMEVGAYDCRLDTIRYDTIDDLHWKTDRQAASLV